MNWTPSTVSPLERPAWTTHALMHALFCAAGERLRAECERVNLMGSVLDERSMVQA